jgi:hypothetical protein
MKERIFTGWNIQRGFYFLAGIGIVVMSIADRQWIGVAMGTYFAAMGLFAFGCAAGNCYGGSCKNDIGTTPDAFPSQPVKK